MEVYVKVDKQFLVEELYRLKKHLPAEESTARDVLQEILLYVNSATLLEDSKNKLPRMRGMKS
jgi:hypothetical protein